VRVASRRAGGDGGAEARPVPRFHQQSGAQCNVELTWSIDDAFLVAAKYDGTEMLERKQIRELPADCGAFINTRFVREVAK
jgi:hypothetical protein